MQNAGHCNCTLSCCYFCTSTTLDLPCVHHMARPISHLVASLGMARISHVLWCCFPLLGDNPTTKHDVEVLFFSWGLVWWWCQGVITNSMFHIKLFCRKCDKWWNVSSWCDTRKSTLYSCTKTCERLTYVPFPLFFRESIEHFLLFLVMKLTTLLRCKHPCSSSW